jgi:hypothetical protein
MLYQEYGSKILIVHHFSDSGTWAAVKTADVENIAKGHI